MIHRATIRRAHLLAERERGWYYAACRCGWISHVTTAREDAAFEARAHLVMVAKRDMPAAPPFDTPPQED